MFILCVDHVLWTSIGLIKENGFTLKKKKQDADNIPQKLWQIHYSDDLVFHANTPAQAASLLHSLEQAAGGIGLSVTTNKTEYMCFKQEVSISTLYDKPLKLVD